MVVLDRERRGPLLRAVAAWLPFAGLTVGFLALRRALFGQTLRAGLQNVYELEAVLGMIGRHLQRVVLGHVHALTTGDLIVAAGVAGALAILWVRRGAERRGPFTRALVFFGAMWLAIGLAPVARAGYESPRHAYLASVGWAFVLALLVDRTGTLASRRAPRRAVAAVLCALLIFYVVRLVPAVEAWNTASTISRSAVDRISQEAAAAQPGTLLIAGVPRPSWEWSAPFALQPPFAPAGLVDRVHLVTPWRLHCCNREPWNAYTRDHLRAWLGADPRPPIVALNFAAPDGAVSRVTDAEYPDLRHIVPVLLQTQTSEELDAVIRRILERLVVGHGGS